MNISTKLSQRQMGFLSALKIGEWVEYDAIGKGNHLASTRALVLKGKLVAVNIIPVSTISDQDVEAGFVPAQIRNWTGDPNHNFWPDFIKKISDIDLVDEYNELLVMGQEIMTRIDSIKSKMEEK